MNEINFIGSVWKQNCDDELKVLEKTDKKQGTAYLYRCQFQKYPCEILAQKSDIEKGKVANYLYPSIFNKGYMGIGKYNYKKYKGVYKIWYNILSRCYKLISVNYIRYGAKGVIVCDEWLNFQNFCQWYLDNSKWNINNYILEVDKDILLYTNHLKIKIYSPDTCLLIPMELNSYLAGDCLECGIENRNNKFRARICLNKKQIALGTFNTFKEAKEVYAKEKKKYWFEEVNKFKLPNYLKETLLKYDFSWSWIWENMTEEEIREKYYTK